MSEDEKIKDELTFYRRKLISSHFKYNKFGFIIDKIYDLSKNDIQYARDILNKIESGISREELMDEIIKKQKSEELKYSEIIENLEKNILKMEIKNEK